MSVKVVKEALSGVHLRTATLSDAGVSDLHYHRLEELIQSQNFIFSISIIIMILYIVSIVRILSISYSIDISSPLSIIISSDFQFSLLLLATKLVQVTVRMHRFMQEGNVFITSKCNVFTSLAIVITHVTISNTHNYH